MADFVGKYEAESNYDYDNLFELMTAILELLHNDCVVQDEEIRKEYEA